MSSAKLLGAAALLTLAAGCPEPLVGGASSGRAVTPSQGAPGSGDVIATIGQATLTVGDIEARLNAQSPFVRARFNTDERKKEFVDTQVRFEVLAQEAFRRGMHNDADVQDSLKKILVQKLTRQEFDGRVSLQDVTDAEMRAYYEAHQADYNKPEMMRASHILIPFGSDKEAARKQAEAVRRLAADPARLEDRNHFKALAAEHTADETTKRTGGDLRYLTPDEVSERLGPAVKDALFASQTLNEVLPVLEGEEGFHIVKRTGRRKPIERNFEQVKNQIRNVLFREKRTEAFNAYIEGLKKELGVVVNDQSIAKIRVQAVPAGDARAAGRDDGHGHGQDDGHGHDDGQARDDGQAQAPGQGDDASGRAPR